MIIAKCTEMNVKVVVKNNVYYEEISWKGDKSSIAHRLFIEHLGDQGWEAYSTLSDQYGALFVYNMKRPKP
jgi:hypothetical protein